MTALDPCATADLMDVDEALRTLLAHAQPLRDTQTVDTLSALGRVLATTVLSPLDLPPRDTSAMDGFAVRARDLVLHDTHAQITLPISQRIAAGQVGTTLIPGTAARIFTGAPLPAGADTVIMQEDGVVHGNTVHIRQAIAAGVHVRKRGSEVASGATLLTTGQRLRPQDLGLAACVGLATLTVIRRLRVALFATGDELIAPGQPLMPGQVYDTNRYTLTGLLQNMGVEILDLGVCPDSLAATRTLLSHAARQADLVLTTGGVSVGEEDHVRTALTELGECLLWRIAIKPGKPFAFGRVGTVPFIGLPGNPVSTLVTFCLFVRPFLLRMQGMVEVLPRPFAVRAGFEWPHAGTRREYLRARLERHEQSVQVTIHPQQGSAALLSASWADGLVCVPQGTTVTPGQWVDYLPFNAIGL